jgi:hypothetical protein
MNLGAYEHLWIGVTHKSDEEYFKYFEIDCEHEIDDPNYKPCGFCKDTGWQWYDEDFSLFLAPFQENMTIIKLLEKTTINKQEYKKILNKCEELGISKANALFSYGVPDEYKGEIRDISKPYKDSYNDLKYIGLFKTGY